MKRQTLGHSMIAGVFGIVLLAGCSTNPAPAVNPGMMTGETETATPLNGLGVGGGMMGGGSLPIGSNSEKSFGVVTIDRDDGGRVRSVIDANGTSFSAFQILGYLSGSYPVAGGGLAPYSTCLPQMSYLTVGDSGTVRFTRKNKDLFARITLRTRSGKIVPETAKRVQPLCEKEYPAVEKAEGVSEKILTKLVPLFPGKETRVVMGKTTVTVFIDKDFPVAKVPAYPDFSSLGAESFDMGTMGFPWEHGMSPSGMMPGMMGDMGQSGMMGGGIAFSPLSPQDKKKIDAFTHCLHLYTDQPGKDGDKALCKKQFPFIDSQAKFYLKEISAEQLSTIMYGNTKKVGQDY